LRVFEDRELKTIFGPKRDEVAGGCGKLHNEELHSLYSSSNIIRTIKSRRIGWAGYAASMDRILYKIFVGKPEGKRSLKRCRRRWKYSIEMDLKRNRVREFRLD
jgi:hypothetical protein